MKNTKLFFLFLFLLIFLNFSFSQAIGIIPAKAFLYFEPNYEGSFDLFVDGMKPEGTKLITYIKYEDNAELNGSVSLSDLVFLPDGRAKFTAYIKLPPTDANLTPGIHRILIGVKEVAIKETNVAALTAVQVPLDIFVPYKGSYIEVKLEGKDIAINEVAVFKIKIKNLGTSSTKIKPEFFIYTKEKNLVYSEQLKESSISEKEEKEIEVLWNSSGNNPGEYIAKVIVYYEDKKVEAELAFKIGELNIEIIDFTKEFRVDSLEKFKLKIQSKWNNEIKNIYAEVSFYDITNQIENKPIKTFKTALFDLKPWEIKEVIAYFDTKGIKPQTYVMNVSVIFDKKVISVESKAIFKPKISDAIIIGIIIIIIILVIIVIRLILKKKKKEREEKEKIEKRTKRRRQVKKIF